MGRFPQLCVLVVAAIVTLPSPVLGQFPQALFGTWELDAEASVQSSDRFKRITCQIEPWEDGMKVTYDSVGQRGGVLHMEWRGRFDGNDYPVEGVDFVLTNAYTPMDSRTYQILIKVDGAQVAIAETRLSPDGRTLTTLTRERDDLGEERETRVVYERR